jgi:hypothetical protein
MIRALRRISGYTQSDAAGEPVIYGLLQHADV